MIREDEMAEKKKTYHATMLVTRAEEWCVEAETAEEARELLAQGHGHRCHLGERLHAEVHQLLRDRPGRARERRLGVQGAAGLRRQLSLEFRCRPEGAIPPACLLPDVRHLWILEAP